MACDTAALLEQAKCLQTCIMPGQMAAVQLAALCNIASGVSSPLISETGGLFMITDDAATNFAYSFWLQKRGDTGDVTAPVGSGAELGNIQWQGWNGSAYITGAAIVVKTDEAFTAIANGTHIEFRTVAVGATLGATKIQIGPTDIAIDLLPLNIGATSSLQLRGAAYFNPLTVYATGTVYTITAVSAAVDFGTTDPIITVNATGTYLLRGRVRVALNGATFAANRTLTVKLRRTNNTPADVANSSTTWIVPIVTTITNTLAVIELPEVSYTTALTTDTIQLFADISVLPSAGSISIDEASIVAIRIS
jgi:hypothetical protein